MQKNVGPLDKVVRLVIAAGLFSLWFVAEPPVKYLAFVGIVPALTALVGNCPLYALLGVNTCRTSA